MNYKKKYLNLRILLVTVLALTPMKINNVEYRTLPEEPMKLEKVIKNK